MTSIKKLKEIFETNFFAQTIFTQYILKSMVKKKSGSILYISSSSALDGNEGRSAYSSTKSAIIAQAKVLSREIGIHNIRVNILAPGLTNTDMMTENSSKEIIINIASNTSLKRIADPKEIANVALLISSDLASYITGQVIRVDGGM
jgi:3-oxoacyl-[acyl-carrier protein] reductase